MTTAVTAPVSFDLQLAEIRKEVQSFVRDVVQQPDVNYSKFTTGRLVLLVLDNVRVAAKTKEQAMQKKYDTWKGMADGLTSDNSLSDLSNTDQE